jgi:glucuronate isomerase
MAYDTLQQDIYTEICHIPIIDPHSHIDPLRPTAKTLDDILGYHYYTELAFSVGMDKKVLEPGAEPRERVRAILYHLTQLDNTAQYRWFLEICRAFLNFQGPRITLADFGWLWDNARQLMTDPDWEERIWRQTNLERVVLTNDFDDPLEGFDTERYVPCLRTDDLVFRLKDPAVAKRLAKVTGIEAESATRVEEALAKLFERFLEKNARACAVSLPTHFSPAPLSDRELDGLLQADPDEAAKQVLSGAVFWLLAKQCRQYKLPFFLMIGVERRVFEHGVYQGQDLFDQRTSLIQYAPLFNAFPDVTFCLSVLSSGQNQELVSYSWIFPNVITSGHWWYSNIPAYIRSDLLARLQAVPKTKQIGYYSDMYKLEFGLPKFNMYRRILAGVLAEEFVRTHVFTEAQAVETARLLLHDNPKRILSF